jgi:ankyrin repeat protein
MVNEDAMKALVVALRERQPLSALREIVEERLRHDPHFLARTCSEVGGGDSDSDGWILLHHAVSHKSEIDVVKYLAKACPPSVRIKTLGGNRELALHLELRSKNPNPNVVRFLVNAVPASLLEPAADGSLPLHASLHPVARANRRVRVRSVTLQLMIEKGPEALLVKGPKGRLPIHCLLECNENVKLRTVEMIADSCPDALLVRDDDGWLPVHSAVRHGSLESENWEGWDAMAPRIMMLLAKKCPRSIQELTPDTEGGTLLHMVIDRWASHACKMVPALAELCPEVLAVPNAIGDRPFHAAVLGGQIPMVRRLADRRPELVRVRGYEGRLPIHIAASGQEREMPRYLLTHWPESIDERDAKGRTPLHYAVIGPYFQTFGSTVRTIQYLLEESPGLIDLADNEGRLPLHTSVAQDGEHLHGPYLEELVAVVQLLIERHPDALQRHDARGNLPFHVAVSHWVPVPVLRPMTEQHPDCLLARNADGLLPVQLALHREQSDRLTGTFERFPSARDWYTKLEVATIGFLVKQRPESLRELDTRGRTLVHQALDGPTTPGHLAVPFLLQKWSGAVLVRDRHGRSPLHVAAAAADAPLDVLYAMLQLQMKLLRERGSRDIQSDEHLLLPRKATTSVASRAVGPSSPKRARRTDDSKSN